MEQHEQPKGKGGRPKGSRNKVGDRRVPPPTWLRDLVASCFTREQWIRKFRSLPDDKQFEIASRLAPKTADPNAPPSIRLFLSGVGEKIKDRTPHPQLPDTGQIYERLPGARGVRLGGIEEEGNDD